MRGTAGLLAVLLLGGCTSGGGHRTAAPAVSVTVPAAPAATLTATIDGPATQRATVLRILSDRLTGLGVTPAGVDAAGGGTLTFRLPRPLTAAELVTFERPGFLAFRPVRGSFPPDGPSTVDASGDCGVPADRRRIAERFGGPERSAAKVVACDADGGTKYDLGPAEMTGTDVKTAAAEQRSGQWVVELEMKSASRWASLTEKYVNNQLAIVLDGEVQSAPNINEKITGGTAQVSGTFTEESARALALVLRYGALPARVTVSQTNRL